MASGSIVWPSGAQPIWTLNWELNPQPDEEGIVIRNAYYHGHQVFYKASLPVIRVEYYRPIFFFWMGPFKDPLHEGNALTTPTNPLGKVNIYTSGTAPSRALNIEAYYVISSYHLYQTWTFYEYGSIRPRLFSKGLQYPYDHKHHVYWRFDFDIDGPGNNQLLEFNTNTGWFVIANETWSLKDPSVFRRWQVRNKSTGRSFNLRPGPNDGVADSFSRRDIWHLAYVGSEDLHGRQGNAYDDKLDAYLTGAPLDGRDVVWWYAAHLFHSARDPVDEWHSCGPILYPVSW